LSPCALEGGWELQDFLRGYNLNSDYEDDKK